jgi:hypothetical protein
VKPGGRVRWICLGMLILALNLFALAAWRFTVYWSGPRADQGIDLDVSAAAGIAGTLLVLGAIGLFAVWGLTPEWEAEWHRASNATSPSEERRARTLEEPRSQWGCRARGVSKTPDGWFTSDPAFVRFLVEHPPPRPHAYWNQLRLDARYGRVLFFWALGLAPIAFGVTTGGWLIILAGLVVVGTYLRCLVRAVANYRHSPVALGVVTRWDTPPEVRGFDTASARLSDGREIRVASCRSPVPDKLDPNVPIEVLVLHQPTTKYSMVIAVRPIPELPAS